MRRFFLRLVLLGVFGLGAMVALMVETAPSLPDMAPPTPQYVAVTRQIVHQIQAATNDGAPADAVVRFDVGEMNQALRLVARFLPQIRTRATLVGQEVHVAAALPVPGTGGNLWLNAAAVAPPFDGQFRLRAVRVGRLPLPAGPALWLGRVGANLIIGGNAGDRILNSAARMQIDRDDLVFSMRISREGRGQVIRDVFGALRGNEMPSLDEIERYHVMIRDAMDAGQLPVTGSFLPYIRFALEAALADSTDATIGNNYTAALFALGRVCGARDFGLIVGRMAGPTGRGEGDWKTHCRDMTFAGRIDSRRHFITAAAIEAASNRGFAISVGEFKELHDAFSAAGGFDFTDIVANNSGIRMSERMMAAPVADWPNLIARIQQEADVLASFDGIPGLMSEAEFKVRFGDVDSPRYYDMLGLIEARIDHLALHADPS